MSLLEPNFYALWLGKQTAKGTPNTAPGRRPIMVGGNISPARDDGAEQYSDLTKYGGSTDWVNSVLGTGEPGIEATPDELAHLLWLYHGGETVTALAAVTGPPAIPAMSQHRFTPSSTLGFFLTAFLRVGSSNVRRHQFNDTIITKVALEASSANKALRVTPSLLSLDPAQFYATDPTAALPTDRPFLHTDLSQVGASASATIDGSMTIDGVVFRGVTQFATTIDDAYTPVYGDSTQPYDFVQGDPKVTVGATLLLDAAGLAEYNRLVYGTSTPSAGARPVRTIPALGSFAPVLRQRDAAGAHAGRELAITVPGIKWTIPDAPAPNVGGGSTEIALAGDMRPVAGLQPYTIDVRTASTTAAFTA